MIIAIEGEDPHLYRERDKWPYTNYQGVKIVTKLKNISLNDYCN